MDFTFAEHTKVIPIQAPEAITHAAMTTEYISAKHAQKLTWFLYLGVLDSNYDDTKISIRVGNDKSGTQNTNSNSSMDFVLENVWKGGQTAGSSADTLVKQTITTTGSVDSVALTSTSDGRIFVVEVSCAKLGTFSSGSTIYDADYVSLVVSDPGSSGNAVVSLMCIATGLRYKQASPPTAIT